ncbi:hypothetical protein IC617_08925 [Neiella sp. HB171785]|uniref:Uncharacterized protein n=1 Tax=Neiella litorisoli TaxID=2771431 RepID=A0A8J6ULV5_9GAMM|nr:hypothetical protein [Neiella litorisoli]MBD1389550.1 hypothetical protein [Neiella litorisoli]
MSNVIQLIAELATLEGDIAVFRACDRLELMAPQDPFELVHRFESLGFAAGQTIPELSDSQVVLVNDVLDHIGLFYDKANAEFWHAFSEGQMDRVANQCPNQDQHQHCVVEACEECGYALVE